MHSIPSASRRHGFRLSVRDGFVLAAGSLVVAWLCRVDHPLWSIVAMALGHFFLFCNVFLVWQRWEMLWAAVYIANVAAHLALGRFEGLSALLFQLPVTFAVIWLQMRSPWYHGILARRINPRLNEYLDGTL